MRTTAIGKIIGPSFAAGQMPEVIARLLEVSRTGLFLSISTVPDVHGVLVREPLHQTVQSFVQWRDQIAELGRVVEARDLLVSGCYLVEPVR